MTQQDKTNLAYIIGIALGDGNLSNPNGRAVRLRITCDTKYPNLIKNICDSLQKIFPNNKVTIVKKLKTCIDISCYSNKLEKLLGWQAKGGSKYNQKVGVPDWIKTDKKYVSACLLGLLQTDGSIYSDRGYKMVNFVTIIPILAQDTIFLIKKLGYRPKIYKIPTNHKTRYNIKLSQNVQSFIDELGFYKN